VCVYVCMRVCIYAYTYVYMNKCMHLYIFVQALFVCMYALFVHASAHVRRVLVGEVCVNMHVCTSVGRCAQYICLWICMITCLHDCV